MHVPQRCSHTVGWYQSVHHERAMGVMNGSTAALAYPHFDSFVEVMSSRAGAGREDSSLTGNRYLQEPSREARCHQSLLCITFEPA